MRIGVMVGPERGRYASKVERMAFVVLRPNADTTGDDIIVWARAQIANYKVPRAVELVDELPLNATGKVMKDVLRERVSSS